MKQNSATKLLIAMPGYSRLFRRSATYYFRVGVPEILRPAIGKREILKSLHTTNFNEAKRLVAMESASADALFERERKKLNSSLLPPREVRPLSDAEVQRLVVEWFVGLEKKSEEWWAQSGRLLNEADAQAVLVNIREDQAALVGRFPGGNEDGSHYLRSFFAEQGLELPVDHKIYSKLCELFRRGMLENLRRTEIRIERGTISGGEPFFQTFFAHSPLPQSSLAEGTMTLGELLDRFMERVKAKCSETTYMTYQTPVRVLREILGNKTPLSAIDRESIECLCKTLRRMTIERNSHIDIWLAVVDAFKCFVRSSSLIRHGVQHLASWWSAVEAREKNETTSANQLEYQLRQLDQIIAECKRQEVPDEALLEYCTRSSESLAERLSIYKTSVSPNRG
jgi:hypothetical protein